MGTTPTHGLPYPEGTDLVTGGDDAIEALASAVDTVLTRSYLKAWDGVAGGVALGTAGFPSTPLVYGSSEGVNFTSTDASTYTYTGPAPKWFLLGCGAYVYSTNVTLKELQLRVNNVQQLRTAANTEWPSLSLSWTGLLSPGDVLSAVVGSTIEDASYFNQYLWAVSVP